jgi:acyl-CoA dehydrogenase
MNVMIRDAVNAYETRNQSGEMGFNLSAKINRIKIDCSELLIEIGTRAMTLIGLRGYARGGPYSLAVPLADAFSGPIMVSNYRLALNTAKIERFIDETL